MAAPASKRRKVEHNISHDEEYDSSFASFGESQGGEEEDGGDLDGDQDQSAEESVMDEDTDDGELHDKRSDKSALHMPGDDRRSSDTPQHRKVVGRIERRDVALASSPYVAGNHKSALFKLQVDDLLEQIRPRHGKRETQAEEALHTLKKAIENIPDRGPLGIDEAEKQLLASSKVQVPFPDPRPPKDAKYKLEYAKPTNVNVIGSHALKTASRSRKTTEIDMVVTMPSSLFQEKDYLNFRYFYKRAYYVASIAAGLKVAVAKGLDLKFCSFHDNPLKPILVVTPAPESDGNFGQSSLPKWKINIIPCIVEDAFQPDKVGMDRSCVRNQSQQATSGSVDADVRVATPFYNSSLRSDMLPTSYLKLLYATSKTCESFRDACLLGSTWLRQRGFGSGMQSGGFGNFEWSALVAGLLKSGGPGGRPILSEGYSAYQLFKATVQLLAMRDCCKQPLVITTDGEAPKLSPSKQPVVWDANRKHNVLFKMAPWSYQLLRQEARTTLNVLNDQQFDGFDSTFILRTDGPLTRYDYVLELDVASITTTIPIAGDNLVDRCRQLYDVLHQGLGDRAKCISIIPGLSKPWSVESITPNRIEHRTAMIGIMINAENAGRTIDHGPAAEEKSKAAVFRKFWGEKAELRRFKDGSISETLVWSGKEGGPSVVEQILRHVIQRQFGTEVEQKMTVVGDTFRKLVPQGSKGSDFQAMMDGFKQLESDIRSLDGLPLVVRQIMPADSQLRYASKNLPFQGQCTLPADVVIQFEGSARWPDDLVAIQRTKIAFLLKLRESLLESIDSVTPRLGLENEGHSILNQGFLDIVYDSGAALRLRIHHDREQTLLERNLKDKTIEPAARDMAALGLATYKRSYIKAPAHTQALASLCGRHPALSGTIRLLKKWFATHLLANHIADEVIELIAARSFAQPWPWETPASVQTAFLRTLFWISRWDWKVEPLIVDMSGSGDVKLSDTQSIKTKFEAWRKLDPALNRMVLFAASNVDPDGTTWTDGHPAKVVAGRMTALARAACAVVTEKELHLTPTSLFESPLTDFDFVIRFDSVSIGQKTQRKQSKTNGIAFKNLELDLNEDTSRVGLNSFGDFLQDIQALYGSAALFFSGGVERPIVAGLWNPQTARRPWKLNLIYSTMPVKDSSNADVQADVNKEAILAEIARLGGDMIHSIERNR